MPRIKLLVLKINVRKEQMDKMLENQKAIITLLKKLAPKEDGNTSSENKLKINIFPDNNLTNSCA